MRAGPVKITDIRRDGTRLTGGFHLAEDQVAVARVGRFFPCDSLWELCQGRRIFRGAIFARRYAEDRDHGEPYVSSKDLMQADVRPSGYLSLHHGTVLDELRLRAGMILITCSGMNLGEAIWTRSDLDGLVATHDLIRVVPDAQKVPPGYVYAFLSSRYGRALIRKQIYGGNIKHVEPEQLWSLPIPRFDDECEERTHELVEEAAALRAAATGILREVCTSFNDLIADIETTYPSPRTGAILASTIQRRFDAQYHDPIVQLIRTRLRSQASTTIGAMCTTVFLPGIFKRIYAEDPRYGAPYFTGASLFWLEPIPKGILSRRTRLYDEVELQQDTILVQAFGQDGGITGRAVWVGHHLHGATSTHMLCRLQAEDRVKTAYLFGFLNSKAAFKQISVLTYGGSIPHFDEAGISTVVVPLLGGDVGVRATGERVLLAVKERDAALSLEREARALVERAIEEAT